METLIYTQLSATEVRQLFRQELIDFFAEKKGSLRPLEIIDSGEMCRRLAISLPTLIRWRKAGKIPYISIGKAIRFNFHEAIFALESQKKKK